jgi:hypothetical protein
LTDLAPEPEGSPQTLFGGDIVYCKRLRGSFFRCRFT